MKKYILKLKIETELEQDDSFVELHDRLVDAIGNIIDVNNFGIDVEPIIETGIKAES